MHSELYTMLWKYLYNWLGSMAAINSCPSIKWFKWPRKRTYISCCPLWDQHRTPMLPQNAIDPSLHFANRVWCRRHPPPRPSRISFWKLSEGSNFPSPWAELQRGSETKKLLFNPFSPLVYVKPSLNVTTVFACQWVSVCSSLFSDVDSLIACEFRSLC